MTVNTPTTIIIVDDHTMLREAWSQLINNDPEFEVIGTCGHAEEAMELIRKKVPDILMLDVSLPQISGLQAAVTLLELIPDLKILGISMYNQTSYALKMMKIGAMGYLTKTSPTKEMFTALRDVRSGRKYISQEIKELLTQEVLIGEKEKNRLTGREMELIDYLKKGLTSSEIAKILSISTKTVEVHRYNILKKLNLKNTAGLINYLNKNQLGN
jgi:DNA-binding NarL/FixJ family response regulator